MSQNLKILFDENFGKPLVDAIGALLKFHRPDPPSVEHLHDFTGKVGERDEEWIPKAADEEWVVISADRGASGGSSLPRICEKMKVRHVLISSRLHQLRQFEKARAIIIVWPELLKVMEQPKGARFKLKFGQKYPILQLASGSHSGT